MLLFFIGVLEMVILTAWTKVVGDNRVAWSGLITLINIFIWYYVLSVVVSNISNVTLIIAYALGCASGTMITTLYFQYQEKLTGIEEEDAE